MSHSTRTLLLSVFAIGLALPAFCVAGDPGLAAYYAPSPYKPIRAAMSVAQRDLAKATAAAVTKGGAAEKVAAAQAAVAKSRLEYQAALRAARQTLAADPTIGPLQRTVADAQKRLADQDDAYARLAIAGELMDARNKLDTAEWEVLGVDPDLAVDKAAIDDAQQALQVAKAEQSAAVRNDPAVAAARQRVVDLSRQLRGH